MRTKTLLLIACAALLASGCGKSTSFVGDGGGDAEAPEDNAAETAPDVPRDPVPDEAGEPAADFPAEPDAEESTDTEDSEDGPCCTPPMVLDPFKGICVDPTGHGTRCDDDVDKCLFGQLCTPEFGIAYLGDFCELPCSQRSDYLCPAGYVCFPPRCCDIPGEGCIPDTCTPPLLMHPGTETCVSTEGLGRDCSDSPSCAAGQICLEWYGESGDPFHTCEIECAGNPRLCPNGTVCVDVADGPQNVCWSWGSEKGCVDPGAETCGRPEKFGDLRRDRICWCGYGSIFCVTPTPEAAGLVESMAPDGLIVCNDPGIDRCGADETTCIFQFRPDASDCPDLNPSDFYWSVVCEVAALDAVQSVDCYYLE